MANILFIEYVGFFAATLFTGILTYKFGIKNIFLTAVSLWFIGIAFTAGVPLYYVLMATFILIGTGLGMIEVVCSSSIVIFHSANKGKYFNLLNAFYGVGSMLVPLYAGALLANNVSWRLAFVGVLLPVILFLIFLKSVRFPGYQRQKALNFLTLAKTAFTREMVLHYLALCFYVAAEIALAAWMVEYMLKVKGQPIFLSSLSLAIYFALLTLGRFLGCLVVDRFGHLRMLLLASIGALVCLILGIYGPSYLAIFLPFTGFFYAILFPTIAASFTDIKKPEIEKYLGFLFTFAGVGGIIGPWLVGTFAEQFRLAKSIAIVILFTSIMLLAILSLLLIKNQAERHSVKP